MCKSLSFGWWWFGQPESCRVWRGHGEILRLGTTLLRGHWRRFSRSQSGNVKIKGAMERKWAPCDRGRAPEESPREAVHEPRGQLQQKSSAVWRCQSQPESRRQSVWLMLLMDRAREVCVPKPFEHRRFWVNPRPLTPSFTLLEKEYVQPWEGMWATMRVSLHYCERGCVLPWEGVCAAVGGKCTTMRGSLCYPESELAAFLIISFRFLREVPLHLYSFYQYRE